MRDGHRAQASEDRVTDDPQVSAGAHTERGTLGKKNQELNVKLSLRGEPSLTHPSSPISLCWPCSGRGSIFGLR